MTDTLHAPDDALPQTDTVAAENATVATETDTLPTPEQQRVALLETERNEWKDKAYRLAAEMENLKRRNTQELEKTKDFALQTFAKDLLPVADNFGRALAAPAGNEQALRDGVTLVAGNLQQVFTRHGINQVKALPGDAFNPDQHQVMNQVPSAYPANTLVAELQAGFLLNGRLLRPAFVSVSSGQPEEVN